MPVEHRSVATDRCPGLLRPYQSADGALVRLRLPGGRTTARLLESLTDLATAYGDGTVQITSRGNLQLRGVKLTDGEVDPSLEAAVVALGLLPHPSHELVRTIVASPLSGIHDGLADVMPLVVELDRRMCADPALAALPGRFLWAIDDGSGDMLSLDADLTLLMRSPDHARVIVAGAWATASMPVDAALGKMLTLASRFIDARSRLQPAPWRIAELALPGEELSDDLHPCDRLTGTPLRTGLVVGGVATALRPRLGLLTPAQTAVLAAAYGEQTVVITPWRQVVVPGDATSLHETGLESDPGSPWARITACTGAPGCANGQFDTRRVASQVADAIGTGEFADGLPVHVVACERHCGTPSGPHTLIEQPTTPETE